MTESEQTRICPLCAETIKAAAKVCPHCRFWQKGWSLQNPQLVANLWGVIGLVVLACLMGFMERLFGSKQDFAEYQDQIAIVNSQFSHRMVGSNLIVTVIGVVTNQSDFSWKDVGLETQFFDRDGKLIDVVAQTGGYRSFAILGHSEQAFRLEGQATRPQGIYASHKVRARWAKDGRAWF
jgi:hypothetical protein